MHACSHFTFHRIPDCCSQHLTSQQGAEGHSYHAKIPVTHKCIANTCFDVTKHPIPSKGTLSSKVHSLEPLQRRPVWEGYELHWCKAKRADSPMHLFFNSSILTIGQCHKQQQGAGGGTKDHSTDDNDEKTAKTLLLLSSAIQFTADIPALFIIIACWLKEFSWGNQSIRRIPGNPALFNDHFLMGPLHYKIGKQGSLRWRIFECCHLMNLFMTLLSHIWPYLLVVNAEREK